MTIHEILKAKKPIPIPQAHIPADFLDVTLSLVPPCDFLNSIIVPRPIAFVTSMSPSGIVNAAPFSYFNAVCTNPTILSLSIERHNGKLKDTPSNIFSKKEFVVNVCSVEIAHAVTLAGTNFPPDMSEVELTGLSLIPSEKISVPRIANTLIQLECRLYQVVPIAGQSDLILGEVVTVHAHKDLFDAKGRINVEKLNPIARLAGATYAKVGDLFEIPRFKMEAPK